MLLALLALLLLDFRRVPFVKDPVKSMIPKMVHGLRIVSRLQTDRDRRNRRTTNHCAVDERKGRMSETAANEVLFRIISL
mmetsp:Transcript_14813/g.28150  ORF Transcript_14813/g.28150 Transcript_14813/m.28150 type:complete len:80 (+) Transcript_14813:1509-1748(+)